MCLVYSYLAKVFLLGISYTCPTGMNFSIYIIVDIEMSTPSGSWQHMYTSTPSGLHTGPSTAAVRGSVGDEEVTPKRRRIASESCQHTDISTPPGFHSEPNVPIHATVPGPSPLVKVN